MKGRLYTIYFYVYIIGQKKYNSSIFVGVILNFPIIFHDPSYDFPQLFIIKAHFNSP